MKTVAVLITSVIVGYLAIEGGMWDWVPGIVLTCWLAFVVLASVGVWRTVEYLDS